MQLAANRGAGHRHKPEPLNIGTMNLQCLLRHERLVVGIFDRINVERPGRDGTDLELPVLPDFRLVEIYVALIALEHNHSSSAARDIRDRPTDRCGRYTCER